MRTCFELSCETPMRTIYLDANADARLNAAYWSRAILDCESLRGSPPGFELNVHESLFCTYCGYRNLLFMEAIDWDKLWRVSIWLRSCWSVLDFTATLKWP